MIKKGNSIYSRKAQKYGYPRMKITLQEKGHFINHKKAYRLIYMFMLTFTLSSRTSG
ncbi:IS3 family transposase [Bacillus cereus]